MPFLTKKKACEGDVVELTADLPKFSRGLRGVVMTEFEEPSEAYDIEIMDGAGDFLGFAYSVKPNQFVNLSREAFERAMEAIEREDYTTAEKQLRAAADLRPDYLGLFVNSLLYTVDNDPDLRGNTELTARFMIPSLGVAIHIDPEYRAARSNLAIVYLKLGVAKAQNGMHREALQYFYLALGIESDLEVESAARVNAAISLTSLAEEAYRDNDPQEAFAHIRTSVTFRKDEVTLRNLGIAWGNLGVFLMRSESFDAAVNAFQMAEVTGVVRSEFLNDCGVCLVFLGRPGEAITAFERVLELDPQNDIARSNLAKLHQRDQPPPCEILAPEFAALSEVGNRTIVEPRWQRADLPRELAYA